jgi:ribonuclease T2
MSRRHLVCATAAVLCSLLLLVSTGQAEHPQQKHNAPGDFEFYVLSLSLAPSFCSLSAANRSVDECRQLTKETFEQTPLTIHGLWPNRAHASMADQPAYCSHVKLQLSDAIRTDLKRYMPGGPDLEQHEWQKHGTCSGLSPDGYFAATISLAKQMNEVVGGVLRDGGMLGGQADVSRLVRDVSARNPAVADSMVVTCVQVETRPGQEQDFVVEEIHFTLSKDLRPITASSVGMAQNEGCPTGVGRIPSAG